MHTRSIGIVGKHFIRQLRSIEKVKERSAAWFIVQSITGYNYGLYRTSRRG